MRSSAVIAFSAGCVLLSATVLYSLRDNSVATPVRSTRYSSIRGCAPRVSAHRSNPRFLSARRLQRFSPNAESSDYWLRSSAAKVVDEKDGVEEFTNMDAEFWNDVVRRDERGLPQDVATTVTTGADNVIKVINEEATEPRLLSIAFELDPMPWWTFSDLYMRLNILQEVGKKTGELNALVLDDSVDFESENIDLGPNWKVVRLSDSGADLSDCKHAFFYGCDMAAPDRLKVANAQSIKTKTGDLIAISCSFGYIGDPDPRAVRGLAKGLYKGGMDTVDFLLYPVHKLDEECRGSSADINTDQVLAYPMPAWMREAGYKGTANLGITGCSGTGKSSFMNALRGIDSNDAEAAKVGNVETTMEATPYTFTEEACQLQEDDGTICSGKEHFRLWDLPGAGTPKFPLKDYLRVMGIKYFDLVIVISAGRYTETDLTLMKEMTRNGVQYFAVRTKIDLEVENAMWDLGLNEEETMEVIREDLRFNTGLPDDRIFLVSSREPEKYDLKNLKRTMNLLLQEGIEQKVDRALVRQLSSRRYFNTLVNVDEFMEADA